MGEPEKIDSVQAMYAREDQKDKRSMSTIECFCTAGLLNVNYPSGDEHSYGKMVALYGESKKQKVWD